MCGRVSTPDQEFIARKLQVKHADALIKPGGINLPPTVELPVITDDKPKILQYFYWSLIPFWAKEKPKFSSFNARLENLHESGAWRNLLGKRHCIVITDGFYEWKKLDEKGKLKQPFLIRMKEQQFTLMAGLWDSWTDQSTGEIINSCTIITRSPNEFMKSIHDRMPCLLTEKSAKLWINRDLPLSERMQVLDAIPDQLMEKALVNKVGDTEEYEQLFKP